jgi:hypothetical protein
MVLVGTCVAVLIIGVTRWPEVVSAAVVKPAVAAGERKPEISGGLEGKRAWMNASFKGLAIRKISSRADRTISIELRYRHDLLSVSVDSNAVVTVARAGRAVEITSAEALAEVQALLGGSEAIFAARALLSEREGRSDLKAPEMSLLASAALVASLVGDTDAPRRLTTRFVERHRGVFRPVRFAAGCWEYYTSESTAAWDDLQNCMSEADQDASFFNGAYRRLACNAVWIGRSESAWFQYLGCLSPLAFMAQ